MSMTRFALIAALIGASPAGVLAKPAVLAQPVSVGKGASIGRIPIEHARRVGQIKFNFQALENQADLVLEPFAGEKFIVRKARIERHADGATSWIGDIVGHPLGSVSITRDPRGAVFGQLDTVVDKYVFQSDERGNIFVKEPDPASLPRGDDGGPEHAAAAVAMARSTPAASTKSTPVVRVLVVYTARAAARYNMSTFIADNIAGMNTSFVKSGVNGSVQLAGSAQVAYQEPTNVMLQPSNLVDLTIHMANGNQFPGSGLENVAALRDQYAADVAILILDSTRISFTCGYGRPMPSYAGEPTNAFSVTGDACAYTFNNFAHEIGHNLGGNHDAGIDPRQEPYPWSHGYTLAAYDLRTIMGSMGTCNTNSCNRFNLWSNPNLYFFGQPLGNAANADMRRTLNSTMSVVAGYR